MRFILVILASFLSVLAYSQGWVNNGANVILKDNVQVLVTSANGNYLSKGNGLMYFRNGGSFFLQGNWINNGNTPAIGNNDGEVILNGGIQKITGSTSTSFNTLIFKGTNDKFIDLTTLVGGGYSGVKSGVLNLGDLNLHFQSKTLIINNPNPSTIQTNTGLLLGETSPTLGYSNVQWNIRNSPSGTTYSIPYGSTDLISIPLKIVLGSTGVEVSDSGYFEFAIYPTNTSNAINNRPLPTGVLNFNNQFGIENDIKSVDRFYLVKSLGYSTKPSASLIFPYIDREWDASAGSLNQIVEKDLLPAKYSFSTNVWDYTLKGVTNLASNSTATNNLADVSGAWVLFNYPPCPVAHFKTKDDCFNMGIRAIDSSTVSTGSIDTNVWISQALSLSNRDTLHNFFPSFGNYSIKRKVRSDRGCWDSVTHTVNVYPMPKTAFTYSDTCFGELSKFVSTSNSPTGNPVINNWSIESTNYITNSAYHTFADTGIKTIQLIGINSWGCADTTIKKIEIQPLPHVGFTFKDICEGELIDFISTTTTKGKLLSQKWSVNDILSSSNKDYSQVFNKSGGYDVKQNAINSFGCSDSLTQSVVVKPRAVAKFSVFPDEIFIHEPYVNLVEQTSFANTWEWELGDLSSTEYGPQVFHTYSDTGLFSIRLIAGNDQNCPDTVFKVIRIKPYLKIYIPNAFSPGNPDNINSTFAPAGMLYGLKEMTMEIYNRWGEQLYFTDNINKPWDGTYLGKPVKEGTYLYMIKMKDIYNQIAWHQGTVTVVR